MTPYSVPSNAYIANVLNIIGTHDVIAKNVLSSIYFLYHVSHVKLRIKSSVQACKPLSIKFAFTFYPSRTSLTV